MPFDPITDFSADIDARIADLETLLARWHAAADGAADAAAAAQEEEDAAAFLADGIASGDLDADGNPIPYDTYRSV